MALARATASSSSSKGMTTTTGPKISSCATFMSMAAVGDQGGRHIEATLEIGAAAAGGHLGARRHDPACT